MLRSRCVGRALSHRHEVCAAATGDRGYHADARQHAVRHTSRTKRVKRVWRTAHSGEPNVPLSVAPMQWRFARVCVTSVYNTELEYDPPHFVCTRQPPAHGPRTGSEPRTAPRTRDVAARHTRLGTHRTARGGPRADAGRGFSVRLRHVTRQHAHHTHASELIAAVLTQNSPRARPHEPCVKRSSFPTMCAHT